MTSSASAGCPGMPNRADQAPSCIDPPAASTSSSQCWASVTPSPRAYSSARRISRASCTPLPSSVKNRTPRSASSAIGVSWEPARSIVMAADVRTSHEVPRPRSRTSRAMPAESMAGRGVGHGQHAREPAEGGGAGARLDRLGLFLARLAQVGVQVDEPGGDHAAAGVQRDVGPEVGVGRHRADHAVLDQHVGPARAGGVDDLAAADDDRLHVPRSCCFGAGRSGHARSGDPAPLGRLAADGRSLIGSLPWVRGGRGRAPSPAGRTAPPCGRPRRCAPDRSRPTAAGRPRRRRSRRRGSSARGA